MATTARTIISTITKVKGHFECVLCGGLFNKQEEWSHNAEPVSDGECCGQCNDRIVVPKRLEMFFTPQSKNKGDK
jgi:hypothetical protein